MCNNAQLDSENEPITGRRYKAPDENHDHLTFNVLEKDSIRTQRECGQPDEPYMDTAGSLSFCTVAETQMSGVSTEREEDCACVNCAPCQPLLEEACLRSPQQPLVNHRDLQDHHPPLVLMPESTQEMREEE